MASRFEGGNANTTSSRSMKNAFFQSCFAAILALIFFATAVCLHLHQWLGAPLRYVNRQWYYLWQAVMKESTAILLLGLNQLRSPATAKISGDASVRGQIIGGKAPICKFPDRMILIANHQIYTDWIFFWWTAYIAEFHGHLFVVLKDSIRKIPIVGPGLAFFSWIFLSRRWETDEQQLQDGLARLADVRPRNPMWLLIFPEGTNMSRNARGTSQRWASKSGIADFKHVLLPRSRGLQYCLQGLASTVDWVYDCTIAYDGIPPGEYGQEVHSLRRLYIEGHTAPLAHMYWRRFAVKDIPYEDTADFERWLHLRWVEKEELFEYFVRYGCFPTDDGYTVAQIKLRSPMEAAQVLGSLIAVGAVWWICKSFYWSVISLARLARRV